MLGKTIHLLTRSARCSYLTNTTSSIQRGQAFSIFVIFDDIGKAFGPYIISYFVTLWGRERAFTFCVNTGWSLCGAMCLLMGLFVENDVREARRLEGGDS